MLPCSAVGPPMLPGQYADPRTSSDDCCRERAGASGCKQPRQRLRVVNEAGRWCTHAQVLEEGHGSPQSTNMCRAG